MTTCKFWLLWGGIFNISAQYNWQMSYLHSGPEHAGSQTAPQYNPPPSKPVSQLWSRTAPDAPECEHSAPLLHISVAWIQEDPETEYIYAAFRICTLMSVLQQETHLVDDQYYTQLSTKRQNHT